MFSVLLVNCQKDDAQTPTDPQIINRVKRISLSELQSKIGKSSDFNKLSTLFDVNESKTMGYEQRLSATDSPWIITDEIMMIQKENKTFYTFKIGTTTTGVEFYNLVVSFDNEGTMLSMRILEYSPSDVWLENNALPFSGTVSLVDNTFFTQSDVMSSLSARVANNCIVGLDYEYRCGAGLNHPPGTQNCSSQDGLKLIIVNVYGPCPAGIDAGDSGNGGTDGGYPIDTGNPSGGGNSNDNPDPTPDDTGTPPDGDEDCITNADGNCYVDETIVMPLSMDEKNCAELKKLGNIPIRSALNELKSKVDLFREFGYKLEIGSDPTELYLIPGSLTKLEIPTGGQIYGALHTHQDKLPNGEKVLPMFSLEDIIKLGHIAMAHQIEPNSGGKDFSLFVLTLTVKLDLYSAETYAIKIDDFQTFRSFINRYRVLSYDDKVDLGEALQKKYEEKHKGGNIANASSYLTTMFEFIKEQGIINVGTDNKNGISVYRATDANHTQWTKLTYIPPVQNNNIGTVIETNCN